MAVYGYCRVSTTRQVDEGESLEVQERQLQGYAHMHGLTITEIVVEKGVSGSIPVEQRLKGGALFDKLERGDIAAPQRRVDPLLAGQMSPDYIRAVPTIDLPADELAAVTAARLAFDRER
jgi:Resolvase, N terminal domain